MPNRYIVIPPPVMLIDPDTGQAMLDVTNHPQKWDFDFAMQRLLTNPLWTESFTAMRSQAAIHDAWKDAKDGVIVLAEEDWTLLKQAVETPKSVITDKLVSGFGVHPILARHLVPLLTAIMDAQSTRPTKPA